MIDSQSNITKIKVISSSNKETSFNVKEASLPHSEMVKRDLVVQNSKGTNMSVAGSTRLFSIPIGSDSRASQEVTSGETGKRQTTSQNMLAVAPMPFPRQSAANESSDASPLPIRPPSSGSLDGEESQTSPGVTVTRKACGLLPSKKSITKKDRSKLRKGKWSVRFNCDLSISPLFYSFSDFSSRFS
jgi:hypothetical protein